MWRTEAPQALRFFRVRAALALSLLLCLPGIAAAAACSPLCGDCDGDGLVGILDALEAAQIGVGLLIADPQQQLACDVDPAGGDGDIDSIDALILAQHAVGLPVNLGCFTVIVAPEGYGTMVPVVNNQITLGDPDRVDPTFGCAATTVFFDVRPSGMTDRIVLRVSSMSVPTDLDLYVGTPGVPPGDVVASHYPRRSRRGGAVDEVLELACSGLWAHGASIAVAVHGFAPGGFIFSVQGDPAATCSCGAPTMEPGTRITGMMSVVAGPCPPIPCGPASRQVELSMLPAGTSSLEVLMVGPPPGLDGDYDLWLGYEGVCAGDCYVSNFHGSLPDGAGGWMWGNSLFLEEITLNASQLAPYMGGPIAIGVSVFTGPPGGGAYTLDAMPLGAGGASVASAMGTSPVSGSLAPCRTLLALAGSEDRWQFDAASGDTITIAVDTRAAGSAFDPAAQLRMAGSGMLIAAANNDVPCTFAGPAAGGMDCPQLIHVASATGVYELTVMRSPTGFCTDGLNGGYTLTVLVNGVPALVVPACDDC